MRDTVDVVHFYDRMTCSSLSISKIQLCGYYSFLEFFVYFVKEIKNPNSSTKHLIDFLTLLQDSKQLTVTNVRTLKMTEDVLAVSISPEGKHIAVALLDCHVKVAL